VLSFVCAAANCLAADTTPRPNIIFILGDDVGIGNVSCYGGSFKTPNLDALAQGGIRFELCFSTPLCGPSRSQILTGRYPFRTGMTSNQMGGRMKPANEIMIPTVLKRAGYVTSQVGKWAQLPLQPADWGFDEYLRFQGSGKYWASQNGTYTQNGQTMRLPKNTYLPDVMHDFVVDFITRHRDQPFYIHYALSHIHGPILRTPSTPDSEDLYADNVAYMDKLVGKLVAELDRLKLREKTLVVFAGDNGTAALMGASDRATVNGRPLSGRKGTMLEGGSRVPFIVSWPGTTPVGKVSKDLVDFSDFLPTFAQLASAKLPEDVILDGRSIAPQLKGESGNPREWVYVELNGNRYVRTAQWKLNNAGELFDMKDAPFVELLVAKDNTSPEVLGARQHLQEILAGLVGKELAHDKEGAIKTSAQKRPNRVKARKANRQ
jgi:arylsulfatase A